MICAASFSDDKNYLSVLVNDAVTRRYYYRLIGFDSLIVKEIEILDGNFESQLTFMTHGIFINA